MIKRVLGFTEIKILWDFRRGTQWKRGFRYEFPRSEAGFGAEKRTRMQCGRLFPVAGRAPVVALIPDSGETGAELTPAAARASKGQHERSDEDLTEIAERRPEDLPATLIASCEKLRF